MESAEGEVNALLSEKKMCFNVISARVNIPEGNCAR